MLGDPRDRDGAGARPGEGAGPGGGGARSRDGAGRHAREGGVPEWTVHCASAEATARLGEAFGRKARPGHVFALVGPLGAGKTCFAQGLAQGLGVRDQVTSPTFTVIQRYEGPVPLVHVDAYRLEEPSELRLLGLDDLMAEPAVVVCEWADRMEGLLPADALWVRLLPLADPHARRIELLAGGPVHAALLEDVRREWGAR